MKAPVPTDKYELKMLRHPQFRSCSLRFFLVVTVMLCGSSISLMASSEDDPGAESTNPRSAYRRALILERSLRAPSSAPVPLSDYRTTVATYISIANRYPTHPYAARALWQAADLCLIAFEQAHDNIDRNTGIALLNQLRRSHANSFSLDRINDQLDRLNRFQNRRWLTDVRHDVLGPISRVTLEFDSEVRFHNSRLTNPVRFFFDFHNTEVAPVVSRNERILEEGVINGIRFGRRSNNTTRVVLNASGAASCNVLTLYEPFRIVTDCRGMQPQTIMPNPDIAPAVGIRSKLSNLAETSTFDPAPTAENPALLHFTGAPTDEPSPRPTLFRQLGLDISRVVIDPGHGGRDPGAIGHNVQESVLVLDIAHRVANRLAQYEIETVMTRRVDRYLPLEARTTFANRVKADLFLSIHANAGDQPETRGVETYVLDFASTRETAALATRENTYATGTMKDLDTIVRAISASAKANESMEFAKFVQNRLLAKLRKIDPEIPDLGVKKAPFVVLVGTRVPSVLVEISFISNKRDVRLLETEAYRDMIADGLVEGVLGYSATLKPSNLAGSTVIAFNAQ